MLRAMSWKIGGVMAMLITLLSSQAGAEPRIALVIGNSRYDADIGVLSKPVNDSKLIAEVLGKAGFRVMVVDDIDQKQMKRSIAAFGDSLAAAGPSATGLFFYSGHALQVNGESYLVPLGASIEREADVDIEAIDLTIVLQQMEFSGAATNIVIIDASRNNPLRRGFRTISRGLTEVPNDFPGTFIGYSTAPGTLATDGNGAHSPYVAAIADCLLTPGQSIADLFQRVRAAVLAATGDRQVTWDASTLVRPFFFVPANGN